MLVTLLGTTEFSQPIIRVLVAVSIIALQFSRLSYIGFPDSTVIASKPVHSQKASSPMLVTLLGIVTDAKLLQ